MAGWQIDVTDVSFSLVFSSVIITASFVAHLSVRNAQVAISLFTFLMTTWMTWELSCLLP